MAGTLPTFSLIRQRYQYLRGESDYTTTNAVNDSNMNAALRDIAIAYPFSFLIPTISILLLLGYPFLDVKINISDAKKR